MSVVTFFIDERGGFDSSAVNRLLTPFKGVFVVLSAKKKPVKRTLDQNAYWWAEPVPRIAEYCGYTVPAMHYALLGECFGYKIGPFGKPVMEKPSSSELSKPEFTFLIEWVLDWAPSTLGVKVMPPLMWFERQEAA